MPSHVGSTSDAIDWESKGTSHTKNLSRPIDILENYMGAALL